MAIVRQIADITEEQSKNVQTMARRTWLAGLGAAGLAYDTSETMFNKCVRRGEKLADDTKAEVEKLGRRMRREQRQLERDVQDAEQTLERKLTDVVASLNIPTRRDLRVLDARIAQLNAQLRDLNAAVVTADGTPLQNYDELNVEEINAILPSLTLDNLYAVEQYEMTHQGRVTVLRETERQIAQRLTEDGEIAPPFEGYDELRAEQVIERMDTMSIAELRHVKLYESTHAKRVTVQREVERRLELAWNEAVAA